MSGSRPVGSISVVTERKTAAERAIKPTQGKGATVTGPGREAVFVMAGYKSRTADPALHVGERSGSTARQRARPGPRVFPRPQGSLADRPAGAEACLLYTSP